MSRDVPVNHRYERAYPLGTGYDLDTLKTGGVYDVTDPVNGPDTGGFFIEVFVNAGQSAADTTVIQRSTAKADGASEVRVFDETGGWEAWAAYAVAATTTLAAEDITVDAIADVTGTDVQAVLEDLKAQIDTKADA